MKKVYYISSYILLIVSITLLGLGVEDELRGACIMALVQNSAIWFYKLTRKSSPLMKNLWEE